MRKENSKLNKTNKWRSNLIESVQQEKAVQNHNTEVMSQSDPKKQIIKSPKEEIKLEVFK